MEMLWYQVEETKQYHYMEINTQSIYTGCRISTGGGHSFWTNYKQKYIESRLKCSSNVPWKLYISCPKGPSGHAPASRHFGSIYFGTVDILGVDILTQ